ncbi:MAG: hypothetical protein ACREM8_14600, partial [Vulcanimicrobiaceae bacterium]
DKAHLALAAFRSFGIGTLEADPGLDRLFALLLARYGTLCSGGLHEHAPAKKRSSRKRAPVVE